MLSSSQCRVISASQAVAHSLACGEAKASARIFGVSGGGKLLLSIARASSSHWARIYFDASPAIFRNASVVFSWHVLRLPDGISTDYLFYFW